MADRPRLTLRRVLAPVVKPAPPAKPDNTAWPGTSPKGYRLALGSEIKHGDVFFTDRPCSALAFYYRRALRIDRISAIISPTGRTSFIVRKARYTQVPEFVYVLQGQPEDYGAATRMITDNLLERELAPVPAR